MSGGPPTVANSPRVPCSPPSFPEMETDYHYDVFFAEAPLAPPGMNYEGRYRIAEAQPTFAPSDDAPLANSLLAVLAQPAEALDDETSPSEALDSWTEMLAMSPNTSVNDDEQEAARGTPRRRQWVRGETITLLLSAIIVHTVPLPRPGTLVAIWAMLEACRWLAVVLFDYAVNIVYKGCARAMARVAWTHRTWSKHERFTLRWMASAILYWASMLMCAVWRVVGFHHQTWATWHVVPLRIIIANAGWWWKPYSCGLAICFALSVALAHVMNVAGHSWLSKHSTTSTVVGTLCHVATNAHAGVSYAPRRLRKPRFALRLQHQQMLAWRYQVAHICYVAMAIGCCVFMAAGGQLLWMHRGWKTVVCMLAASPPTRPTNAGRILRLFVLLIGALLLSVTVSQPTSHVMRMDSVAPVQPPGTAGSTWDAQQQSRQWEPGWECFAAEEVLPHTVLDELQPGGKTTVTRDEGSWLDTELNATFGGHPEFTEEHWEEMRAILRRCKDCIANKPQDIKGYHGNATHNTFAIPFKDESKVSYQRPRKYSPGEQEIIDIHCKELLEYGFIEPASQHCRHASNVVVAGKKDHVTGLWTQTRFCVDLRSTNRLSLKDNTLPHRPEDMYQKVAKAKFKTTLDATKAFHQIPMATEEDRDKTAFWWGNQLYRYTSMPFGAAGATAAFIRAMDYELRAFTHCTVTYVDDIVIYSDTAEQHLKDVEAVLRTLGDAGIRLHSGKSTFGASTVDFLGFRIGHNTIGAQEAKCKAIQDLPRPEDKTGLRSILGMMNYYKGLVGEPGGPNYSELARPLNDLLKKEVMDIKGSWGRDQDESLQRLKDALCSGRCLRPIDYTKPIFLYTDWSNHGIGAVLGQKDEEGVEHICVAISRSLGKTEKQYASFQGEMLAAVWAVRTLRQYLHGVHFTLVTDHSPLTTLMEKADLQGQHLRWAISLQEFDFSVQYRPGPKNENADVPSRYPLPTTEDETGARLDRADGDPVEASVTELYSRSFCDQVCMLLAEDPPLGEVARPETQMANYCKLEAMDQLGTGPVQRLFDVHHREELEINVGVLFDTDHPEPVKDSERLSRAAWKALSTLRPVRGAHGSGTPAEYYQETIEQGTLQVPKKVDTRVVDADFYREAREEGVTCYEPCGGLCAGLEMLLRNGVKVNTYLYQDISMVSQAVARARCLSLQHRYPHLLAPGAIKLEQLPPNLEHVTAQNLVDAGAQSGERWVMVCGFPCQDLSPAGKLAGLGGRHSKLFYETVRVLSVLQQL
ncbi:hypothetical protein CYMTET_22402 [Cymbomonas tetramitiformis]|uniref:Reverse transcriptase domain-containing protein n=1 Tax=Cymbomonas tetramitiformis TaxID=36881 RepID=A0AAE0FZZ3_9CHLO|nr:hypothetical protein CYMTET_22402 [Cymbomonas tetramitiformis]